jgi:hypothetical protein
VTKRLIKPETGSGDRMHGKRIRKEGTKKGKRTAKAMGQRKMALSLFGVFDSLCGKIDKV